MDVARPRRRESPDDRLSWRPRRSVAVILGGGAGTRIGLDIPKQLIKIAGRPIIEHTVAAFDAAPEIDDIVVLMTPGHVDEVRDLLAAGGYRKVSAVLAGGATRAETTRLALDHLDRRGEDEVNVLFHDAVRPLVSHRIIRECVDALGRYEAVDVAIGSADTIIEVVDDVIVSIPRRSALRRGQTPQGFRLPTIREAYRRAGADPDFAVTDDCGVVLRYLPHVAIRVIDGAAENVKVTLPVDVHLTDKLFQLAAAAVPARRDVRAYVSALRGRTWVVFGGSSGIGREVGALAARFGADVFCFSRSTTGTHAEDPADVRRALDTATQATGRVDAVVVSTGLLCRGELAATDDETIAASIGSNLLAPVTVARVSLPYLRHTRGHLLFYTSSSYTRGRAGYALYSATKAAVVNLTQALADEWSDYGVRVNCVNPERTASPMRERAFGPEPAGTLLSCAEVALASLDVLTSSLTGQVVDVRLADRAADPAAVDAWGTDQARDPVADPVVAGR
jgi:2-C-methyl-D-erythritol 4-phosphate cytidylyltransferase